VDMKFPLTMVIVNLGQFQKRLIYQCDWGPSIGGGGLAGFRKKGDEALS